MTQPKITRGSVWGFTLVELLVASLVFIIILGVVITMTNQASKSLQYISGKVDAFQNARFAFESVTRAVSNATLNPYYDYYDASHKRRTSDNASTFVLSVYGRYSELEFVCGKSLVDTQVTHSVFFQSPQDYTQQQVYQSLTGLLNVVGFYVEFTDDSTPRGGGLLMRPSFVTSSPRYRYRLMQLLEPTENFSVYNSTGHSWFTTPISNTPETVRMLAENIIALVVCPRLSNDSVTPQFSSSLTSDYEYDSNLANAVSGSTSWDSGATQPENMHQLPPVVRIVMVAVDEKSMIHIQGTSSTSPNFGFDYKKVFQNVSSLDADLETVSKALVSRHINYRIFQTDVAIHGAKWSP